MKYKTQTRIKYAPHLVLYSKDIQFDVADNLLTLHFDLIVPCAWVVNASTNIAGCMTLITAIILLRREHPQWDLLITLGVSFAWEELSVFLLHLHLHLSDLNGCFLCKIVNF